jgi:3'(2'), 5'-bisphosphate nucleotidase
LPKAVVQAVGSSYKYALIAEGAADLSVRRTPTKTWDTAAADAVLTEAGGSILGWDGQPLDYARPDLTNPPFLALGDLQLDWVRRFGFLVGME